MMAKDEKKKKEGESILNNYKRQLAERMAREKADRGEILTNLSKSVSGTQKKLEKTGS